MKLDETLPFPTASLSTLSNPVLCCPALVMIDDFLLPPPSSLLLVFSAPSSAKRSTGRATSPPALPHQVETPSRHPRSSTSSTSRSRSSKAAWGAARGHPAGLYLGQRGGASQRHAHAVVGPARFHSRTKIAAAATTTFLSRRCRGARQALLCGRKCAKSATGTAWWYRRLLISHRWSRLLATYARHRKERHARAAQVIRCTGEDSLGALHLLEHPKVC